VLSFALLRQVPRDSRDEDIDVLLLVAEPTHEADQALRRSACQSSSWALST
jgi:hypothetical protein